MLSSIRIGDDALTTRLLELTTLDRSEGTISHDDTAIRDGWRRIPVIAPVAIEDGIATGDPC